MRGTKKYDKVMVVFVILGGKCYIFWFEAVAPFSCDRQMTDCLNWPFCVQRFLDYICALVAD